MTAFHTRYTCVVVFGFNTAHALPTLRRTAGVFAFCAIALPAPSQRRPEAAPNPQAALARALQGSPASAVVLRWDDGSIAARIGPEVSATPGSAIKPLLLAWALQHGTVTQSTAVYCRRSLQIGQSRLPCTHPADTSTFTAQSALAASCNTYFAALADRLRSADLEAALRATHLPHPDATSDTKEQKELTVLGLRHVTATPLQLAQAYRTLMRSEAQNSPVRLGLADSVRFGMANGARTEGMNVLGKTGTSGEYAGSTAHGWFAGGIPGSLVLVVYVPRGSGADAALLAGRFFRERTTGHVR